MPENSAEPTNSTEQDRELENELKELKDEYENLREQKVRVEQNLENLKEQLESLKQKAEQEFGTSKPEELEKLLEEKRNENRKLVAEYKQHIESIKTELKAVERSDHSDHEGKS